MRADQLIGVFIRDLKTLRRELEAYPDEKDIWRLPAGISNSAGNLALHLTGNVRHIIGAVFCGSGYMRDRTAEFARRDVTRAELVAGIDAAVAELETAASRVTEAMLAADYPTPFGGCQVVAADLMLHFVAHFGYHLGQVDYHRRIVTGNGQTVGAMKIPELVTARKVE